MSRGSLQSVDTADGESALPTSPYSCLSTHSLLSIGLGSVATLQLLGIGCVAAIMRFLG